MRNADGIVVQLIDIEEQEALSMCTAEDDGLQAERECDNDELRQRIQQIEAFQHITTSIQSTLELKEILQLVSEAVVLNMGFDHSLILLKDEGKNTHCGTVFYTNSPHLLGDVEEAISRALIAIEVPEVKGYSPVLDNAMAGKTSVVHHLYEMSEPPLTREECNAAQVVLRAETIVNVPFFAKDKLVGSILTFTHRNDITEAELQALRLLSDQAGIAIHNANLLLQAENRAEALKQSENRYRRLIEDINDGYVLLQEENIVFANARCAEIFGYNPDEIVGQPYRRFIDPESESVIREMQEKEMLNSPGQLEIEIINNEGINVPADMSIKLVQHEGRIAFAAIIRDITERKRAETALQERTQELERSNHELEQFAYVASHDLQEPLRMVASYVQLLARRYKDKLDADAEEFIAYSVDGANRMQKMIVDLLAYSRVGTRGKTSQLTDCENILSLALGNLQLAIEDKSAVVTHDPLPTVLADDSQLVQLFQNLIGNAMKFCEEEVPHIHISARQEGNEWVFSVRDNGIGIAPEYFNRIFVIFQRLHGKTQYAGTGIGLAICKKIVERHDGQIWVESEPGTGSEFRFTIPMNEASIRNGG